MNFIKVAAIIGINFFLLPWSLATTKTVSVPISFKQIIDKHGVKVYKSNNSGSYVTIVDLKIGSISNLTGAFTNTPNAEVGRKSITEFWDDAVKQNTSVRKTKVVINGSFFSQKKDPTPIAFGLKVAGSIISYGYGLNEFPNLISTFSFNSLTRTASIQPYRKDILDSSVTDVVGTLDPIANKSSDKYLPRTFVGIRDSNGDGSIETVIFYSSTSARQVDAKNTLSNFGASAIAMLDGGASTGLIINGKTYISTNRKIPHAIAIYTGN